MNRKNTCKTLAITAATALAMLIPTAHGAHEPAVETPSGLAFKLGDGTTIATWIPQAGHPIAYTEYSVNDGDWRESLSEDHCTASRLTACDPHAVKIQNPGADTGPSYALELRAIGPDDAHGDPAMSEPTQTRRVRNGWLSTNQVPALASYSGWTKETQGGTTRYEVVIDPNAPTGSRVGGPFLIRDRDGDPVRCTPHDIPLHDGSPYFFISGGTFVAGVQQCQIFIGKPRHSGQKLLGWAPDAQLLFRVYLDDGITVTNQRKRINIFITIAHGPLRGKPRIIGDTQEGAALTAIGLFNDFAGVKLTSFRDHDDGEVHLKYEEVQTTWYREDGTELTTGLTYTPVEADIGHRLYVTMNIPTAGDLGWPGQPARGTLESTLTAPITSEITGRVDTNLPLVWIEADKTSVLQGERIKISLWRKPIVDDENTPPLTVRYETPNGSEHTRTIDRGKIKTVIDHTVTGATHQSVSFTLVAQDHYRIDPTRASIEYTTIPNTARPQGAIVLTEDPTTTPPVPLDGPPEAGDTVYADVSTITDQGNLAYTFTQYTWFYYVPVDRYEVILQQGSSNQYTLTDEIIGAELNVRVHFHNPEFGYTATRKAKTAAVVRPPRTTTGVSRIWLSPVNGTPSDGIYRCGDDLRARVQITGEIPYDQRARAVARLRSTIGSNERIFDKISLPRHDPNDPSPISESLTSFEFGYIITREDSASLIQIRELYASSDPNRSTPEWPDDFDPAFAPVTLAATIDGSQDSLDRGINPANCPSTSTTTRSTEPTTVDAPEPKTAKATDTNPAAADGFTARFVGMPTEHTGRKFTFETAFKGLPDTAKNGWIRRAFRTTGGSIGQVRKIDDDRQRRLVTAKPTGAEPMTISLVPAASCSASKAICTETGGTLRTPITATVRGPVRLTVADAQVHEGVNATLDFVVTLHRAATQAIEGYFLTRDGTARAGEDYVSSSGTFTLEPGDTRQTIRITVLDDAVDDDGETVLLEVLVNSSYGIEVADGQAIGTIRNSDPMPKAWIARLGRTIASQAVNAISERGGAHRPSHLTIAGRQVTALDTSLHDVFDRTWPTTGTQPELHLSLGTEDILRNSAFELNEDDPAGHRGWSAWGQGTRTTFDGAADGVNLHGTVRTLFVGTDIDLGTLTTGLTIGLSRGDGTFSNGAAIPGGTITSRLNALYPYVHLGFDEATRGWAMAGFGRGELSIEPHGGDRRYETDLGMHMGAAGARRILIPNSETGGIQLTANADAFWVRTESDEAPGLGAAKSTVSRVRTTLKATRENRVEGGTFTPGIELGLRHDDGDAERGLGLDAGASAVYHRGLLRISAEARLLAAHQHDDYEEWGAWGTIQISPRAGGTGLSVRLRPQLGTGPGHANALWSRIPGADARGHRGEPTASLAMDLGFGTRWNDYPGVFTPYIGADLDSGSGTSTRLGLAWQLAPNHTIRLQGSHRASGENAITIMARVGF